MDDRQKRVPGFDQAALDRLALAVIGAGGLGGLFVFGAVKKGVGALVIYDGDDVRMSNLNRQLFTPRDLGRNKAVCLARNASRMGFMGTTLTGIPFFFQAAVERRLEQPCDLVFCGVDNDETRAYVARRYRDRPVVFAAVSEDAGHGYVAVQQPGGACFGCFNSRAVNPGAVPEAEGGRCPEVPAVFDVLSVVAGLSLYAVDSLVMDRPRLWNFKQVALHGMAPEINAWVERRVACPLCGGGGADRRKGARAVS